jgi:hypothetical protein
VSRVTRVWFRTGEDRPMTISIGLLLAAGIFLMLAGIALRVPR